MLPGAHGGGCGASAPHPPPCALPQFAARPSRLLTLVSLDQLLHQILVRLRHRDRLAHRDRNRVANTALMRPFESRDYLFRVAPWDRKHHLGILRHPEDTIARAWQDHLGLVGGYPLDAKL